MKKITSLILVLAMLVSVFSFNVLSVNAEGEEGTISPKNQQTIQILKTLGIADGFISSYNETATMTRRQFCIYMKDFLGKSFGFTTNLIPFDDVMDYDPDIGVLRTMTELGFMYGFDDNTFRPDEEVTYEDAITVMVNMLGYTLPAEGKGGYPMGYLAVASQQGLLEGVTPVSGKAITNGDLLTLLSNFIDIDVLEQVSFGDDAKWQTTEDVTILSKHFNVYKGTGIVSGTHKSMLDMSTTLVEGRVQIGNSVLYTNDIDVVPYFGYDVEYYYELNKSGLSDLIAISKSTLNEEVVIDVADKGGFEGSDLLYYVDGSDKIHKARIEIGTVTIFNGAAAPFDRNVINNMTEGNLKFIDNNGDGKYDVLFVNCFDYVVVKSIDTESNVLYSKYPMVSGDTYIRLEEDNVDVKYSITDENGNEYDISKIKENDVLRVLKSQPSSAEKIYSIEVSTKYVIGTITSLQGSSPDYDYVYVDNVGFKITPTMNRYFANGNISDFKLGDKIGLLLNNEGEAISYLVATNEDATDLSSMTEVKFKGKLGYLIDHGYLDSSNRTYYFEFLDNTGTKLETTIADEFKFKYADSSVSYDGLKSYKIKSNDFANNIKPIIDTAFNNSRFVFRYELDSESKICELEIATDASSNKALLAPNRLSYVTAIDAKTENKAQRVYKKLWVRGSNVANDFYRPANGSVIMGIAEENGKYITDVRSDFSALIKYFSSDEDNHSVNARPTKTYFYCYGEFDKEVIYAHYEYMDQGIKSIGVNSAHAAMIVIDKVRKVSMTIDDEIEEVIKITGYKLDTASEYEVLIRDIRPSSPSLTPLNFRPGEIITVAKNPDGFSVISTDNQANYINGASLNTSANNNTSASVLNYPLFKYATITDTQTGININFKTSGSLLNNNVFLRAHAVGVSNGRLYLNNDGTASSITDPKVVYFNLGKEKVIVFDMKKQEIRKGTSADIDTVEQVGLSRASIVFVYAGVEDAQTILVYKC